MEPPRNPDLQERRGDLVPEGDKLHTDTPRRVERCPLEVDRPGRTIVVNGEPRPYLSQTVWPGLATVAHLPAAAAPVGVTDDGLPVGIQVIGPALEDRSVVDVVCHIEDVLGRLTAP
jgi:amidase